MITGDDILNLNYYKKEKFTGSYQGMRYLIKKDKTEVPTADSVAEENANSATATVSIDIFHVTIWPGPYNFAATADDKKTCQTFPFSQEGKEQVVNWLNEQWRTRKNEWPTRNLL